MEPIYCCYIEGIFVFIGLSICLISLQQRSVVFSLIYQMNLPQSRKANMKAKGAIQDITIGKLV